MPRQDSMGRQKATRTALRISSYIAAFKDTPHHTRKKHRQIKLQRLEKVRIWAFGLLVHQGGSQDLNRPLQDIAQNFADDAIIMMRCHYLDTGKNMKIFKYCAISLNMVHTGALCGVLTASLILSPKNSEVYIYIYIYTLNSALCAPIARAAVKQLLLGA